MLKCSDGSYYTGITVDVGRRLHQHNEGKGSKYVRSRLPALLVSFASVSTRKGDALSAEYKFKQLSRKQKELFVKEGLEKFVAQFFEEKNRNKFSCLH